MWFFLRSQLTVALFCGAAGAVFAGGGPQNVALVVNPHDPESLEVANVYAELREISGINVVYLPWPMDVRATSGTAFRDRILSPILTELNRRGIREQIDYITFSCGFPYLVNCESQYPEKEFAKTARPMTSITSAAFNYDAMLHNRSAMFGGEVNQYFRPGVATSASFQGSRGWRGGESTAAGGEKYLLATALGVSLEKGNTVAEIVTSLRRSKESDKANYPGTIYYMRNHDIRSQVRHDTFADAVEELNSIGVKATTLSGTAPHNKPDVAGLTTGASHLQLRSSGSTILPGALIDNLTSAGGRMHAGTELNPQTTIGDFIRRGAAGASGAVVEPYAIAAKFPSAALHVHYARGCSLAEAFYQSIASPFHLLIVGDPICQPWARPPLVTVESDKELIDIAGSIQLTPAATYPDQRQASRFEFYIDGVRASTNDPGESFTIDSTRLADGWHKFRVVAVDDTAIRVQGAWTADVQVKNGRDAMQLVIGRRKYAISDMIEIQAASTQPGKISILQLGRVLGTVSPGERTSIDAKTIGRGVITLWGEQEGASTLRSRPLTLEILQ